MNVKIYLSSKLIEQCTFCQLYGLIEVQRDEIRFVVLDNKLLHGTYLIGEISSNEVEYRRQLYDDTDPAATITRQPDILQTEQNFLRLSISEKGKIRHVITKVKGVTIETLNKVLIIYDTLGFANLAENQLNEDEQDSDLLHLASLIKSSKPPQNVPLKQLFRGVLDSGTGQMFKFIGEPIRLLLGLIFRKTALFYHFSEWNSSIQIKGYEGAKWSLLFDIGFGVAIFSLVLWFGNQELISWSTLSWSCTICGSFCNSSRKPDWTETERPAERFFLNCFLYHVELWWTFLIIVSPAIRFLFIPLSILGLLGLSFQLAMLSDLIILISLHAHCFYIYAAVLYRIEVGGLLALYRIVLGKKKNVLRDRVESHEYMNRQLFLATLTFAVLLFLLPTILVYYVVFATLRFAIFCASFLLMTVRRIILRFPFDGMIRWIQGVYTNLESLEIYNIGSYAKENITIIYIAPRSSSFWGSLSVTGGSKLSQKNGLNGTISIGKFFGSLVRGEMVPFIQPDESLHRLKEEKID
ncbi:LOW QUALITY PROTEIN: uncharacterized protein LOC129737596 [Uranotaenia lowii]|uniref:LOW QUALITY PROTEIN: uncharacterized protein LOC129737596 n=1 Tax=Uranotaenia lowii TaxID=190385 RepID=UPI0024786BBF|nr:LOW QUALITY PROTEIN: uncharacterized protein LOC129737596 [Uranotaenia lowii]